MLAESNRLHIRPIEKDDAEALFLYRSDKIANEYQSWIPENLNDVKSFIQRNPKEFNLAETWFQLVIIDKQSNLLIGDIGVHFFGNENVQVELGITLHKEFQGKGYATESLKLVIDYLFKTLNKHRISASLDPKNINSENMLKRLNFRKEAHFIKSYFHNNTWVDDVIYAMLKEDWNRLL